MPGESPPGESPPVPADELATAYLTDPAPTSSGTVRAAAAVVERVARLERNRAARSTLAPGGGAFGGSGASHGAERGDDDRRRAERDAGRIAASADPTLHRLLNTAPRRLRTMPRLDGAAKGTAGGSIANWCGPAGPRAHLLLFRPPPPRRSDSDTDDDDAAGDERRRKPGRRAMDINAELRDVAQAHRRAFAAAASALREPPRAHWWHASTAVKSWSRFVRGWLGAEYSSLRRVAESAAVARAEAVASVARVCTETLRDDASTPDARSNAAMALSSPALLDFYEGYGYSSSSNPVDGGRANDDDDAGAGDGPTSRGIAESATDAIRDALTRGAMDGAERGAFTAYAAAASRCHAADRPRRRLCAEYLSGMFIRGERSGGPAKGPVRSGRVAGAAAEALGVFLRGLGRDVETHGPGAGAWRTETLARYRDVLKVAASRETLASESDNFESDDFEGEALFRVGLTHGEAFAAAGADLAGRGFGHVVSHLRRLEDVLARWSESPVAGGESPGAGCTAAEVAGAVAALPTAAAFALASNAPVDRHVVNALRLTAELASSLHREETDGGNVQSESIRTNALASCGSLLGVALAAGCSVETSLADAVVDALAGVLLGGGGSSSTTTTTTRPPSETAQAAASLGLAACVGGDWILPSVDRVVANRGLSGANGGREKDAGAATLSAPLVWGGEEGAGLAKRALRALEAVASAEGTVLAAGTIAGTRAREAAAWGLAAAAGAAGARAAAWGASMGSTGSSSSRKVPSGGNNEATPASVSSSASTRGGNNGGALGTLAAAALSPDVTDDAATRALSVLRALDRLPAGDWPGALRRLTRRGTSDALADACVALAVAHPGPAVGGGLLESLLGSDDDEEAFAFARTGGGAGFDEFGVREVRDDDAAGGRSALAAPPPPRVLAALGECVAALPRAAAAAALRRCVAAVANVVEGVGNERGDGNGDGGGLDGDDGFTAEIETIRAAWRGLSAAMDRLPRGPWTEDDIVAACAKLCGSIRRAGGPELDSAVDALTAKSGGVPSSAARASTRAADEAAHPFAAKSLRTRLAVAGSIPRGDVPPLATFFTGGGGGGGGGDGYDLDALVATHLVAAGKALRRPPRWLRLRWLEEAAGLPDGLRTLAVLCRAWCGGAVAATGGGAGQRGVDRTRSDARAVVRWLPATLPAAIGERDEKERAAAAKIATILAELATGERTKGRIDAATRNAAVQTVMAVREMLPGDVWERHAWRLESPATADA